MPVAGAVTLKKPKGSGSFVMSSSWGIDHDPNMTMRDRRSETKLQYKPHPKVEREQPRVRTGRGIPPGLDGNHFKSVTKEDYTPPPSRGNVSHVSKLMFEEQLRHRKPKSWWTETGGTEGAFRRNSGEAGASRPATATGAGRGDAAAMDPSLSITTRTREDFRPKKGEGFIERRSGCAGAPRARPVQDGYNIITGGPRLGNYAFENWDRTTDYRKHAPGGPRED
ncbi:unnamed protein product [Pedinophyceae sp. YPF-701]|nr:unnamed protein product [Pedinophyceae sp. YPF-701]